MNIGQYFSTREGMKNENSWSRMIITGLTIGLLLSVYHFITKEEIVVIKPETLGSDAWVTKDDASQSYKEAWGMMLAMYTGNVTPDNVDFIKDRVGPLLSPKIYHEVMDLFEAQAQAIKEDRVTMRFEPRYIEFEEASNMVFVYGYSFVKGSADDEERREVTYEYDISVANYAPIFKDLDSYQGKPRTEQFLNAEEKKQANKRKTRGSNDA